MKLTDKLAQLYAIGYTRTDAARLTRRTDETVAMWEAGQASVSDEQACSLLLRLTFSEFGAFLEQQRALDELTRKGLSRTQIARLIGVGTKSVRAWDVAAKMARGRARGRLLSCARITADELTSLMPHEGPVRGRISPEEAARRVTAMKEAGLWPLEERADKLKLLLEDARRVNITAGEVINLLGISRRTFYEYLSSGSTRLLSIETVERYKRLNDSLGSATRKQLDISITLLTLEERFTQASIVLFGQYHYVGFAARDPIKEQALRILARVTGYHERTVRRYMPLRIEPRRRVPRSIVEAFESVACNLGSLVCA